MLKISDFLKNICYYCSEFAKLLEFLHNKINFTQIKSINCGGFFRRFRNLIGVKKMSLKMKLISCLSAFIIVVSLMLISVFAATNVTLNIGGNVSFTANSVNALITGSIAGNASGGDTLTPIDIDASDNEGAVSMPTDWTNMDLTFSESASPITVTINIQNRSSDRAIAVSLTDSTIISNVTVTRECDNVSINATDSRNIPGGQAITYTFELSVQSQNSSANGSFGLAIGLENAAPKPTYTLDIDLYNNEFLPEDYITITPPPNMNFIIDGSEVPGYNGGIETKFNYDNVETISFKILEDNSREDVMIVFRSDDYSEYEVYDCTYNQPSKTITLTSNTFIIYAVRISI